MSFANILFSNYPVTKSEQPLVL